ncbi:DUF4383 domain-containing protein [Kibdelosporangium aridum]|uniref:DUF4383 domain-containing protein n=1 Tax=Kibdelosporangium aridum TaxID=2030 RepID=UPI00190EEF55|nr:DUF4383 domain-containing protein [Kibdelosporangium aridum]
MIKPPRLADLVHVVFGVAGLVSARTEGGARGFLIGGSSIHLILWIDGLVIDKGQGGHLRRTQCRRPLAASRPRPDRARPGTEPWPRPRDTHQYHLTERFPGITGRVRLHHGTGGYRGCRRRGSGLGPGRVEESPGPNGTATVRSRREMLRDKGTNFAVALALPDLSVASLVADGKVST